MGEKKKILYIVEAMGGGIFSYIVDLSNELINYYDIYIAYAVRKQTPQNYMDYFDKRINLIKVENFCRSINPIKDIKAMLELKQIEKKIKPDIIHLHSSKAGAIGRIAFNGKIPMFYTPHGYSFLMENCNAIKRILFKSIEYICAKRKCVTISCSAGEHLETLKLTIVYTSNTIDITLQDESFERMRFLMGRFERSASEFYDEYVNNNHLFKNEPIKRMSKLTENLLHSFDYDMIKNKRTENFRYLHEHLSCINKLTLDLVEGGYMYPLMIENAEKVRKQLQKKKIYIPILWPSVFSMCKKEEKEYYMSE